MSLNITITPPIPSASASPVHPTAQPTRRSGRLDALIHISSKNMLHKNSAVTTEKVERKEKESCDGLVKKVIIQELSAAPIVKQPAPIVKQLELKEAADKSAVLDAQNKKESIKVLGSQETFSTIAKVPVEVQADSPINIIEVSKWIKKHRKHYRKSLMKLVRKIDYISHAIFEKHLRTSISSFEGQMAKALNGNQPFCVLVEPNKSNQWVAELAYRYLDIKPEKFIRLGVKKAQDYVKHMDSIDNNPLSLPKQLVLFDDGSYSGRQIKEHIEAIIKNASDITKRRNFNYNPNIFVVIPYFTSHARILINELKKKHENIFIAESQEIPTVKSSLPDEDVKLLEELLWSNDEYGGAASRGVYYFAHKIPNDQSFPSVFIPGNGGVFPGKSLPGEREFVVTKEKFSLLNRIITPIYK